MGSFVGTFMCKSLKTNSFQYLRLRQTGENSRGDWELGLTAIEFFGTLSVDREASEKRQKLIEEEKQRRMAGAFRYIAEEDGLFGGFQGILSYLRSESGEDIRVAGSVKRTACDSDYNVADYKSYRTYSMDPWICFDFKDRRVHLTDYTLKLNGCDYPTTVVRWSIEGSDNGEDWKVLDTQNVRVFKNSSAVMVYSCRESESGSFQYLRVRRTEPESEWRSFIDFKAIEFFGNVIVDPKASESRRKLIDDEQERRRAGTFCYIEEEAWLFGPFKGILAHLSEEYGGDIYEQGIVRKNWSDETSEDDGEAYECLCFDFQERRVSLTAYSLGNDGHRDAHPRDWVIEGSVGGGTWEVLDRRYSLALEYDNSVATYFCVDSGWESYQCLRVRMTGQNSFGTNALNIYDIDFFGTLTRD